MCDSETVVAGKFDHAAVVGYMPAIVAHNKLFRKQRQAERRKKTRRQNNNYKLQVEVFVVDCYLICSVTFGTKLNDVTASVHLQNWC